MAQGSPDAVRQAFDGIARVSESNPMLQFNQHDSSGPPEPALPFYKTTGFLVLLFGLVQTVIVVIVVLFVTLAVQDTRHRIDVIDANIDVIDTKLDLALTHDEVECVAVKTTDALLIIDVQNDFMEATAHEPSRTPLNPIPESKLCGDKICAGSLAVSGSSQIIAPINEWIRRFTDARAHIFASLDWHPQEHCSFCRNGTEASNPQGFHPDGGLCGPGGKDTPNFDYTGMCTDGVAEAAYEVDELMQWPDHCRSAGAHAFGSRFHPYLAVNRQFHVVKKGFDPVKDSYSAFGGRESAQGFPFDTTDSLQDLAGRSSLADLLVEASVERLFVVGIATDYCVLHSTLDALGRDPDSGRAAVPGLREVVLVEGATRGVVPATVRAAVDHMRAAGALVSEAASPTETLQAICNRTCVKWG